jgi:hypothetical protein
MSAGGRQFMNGGTAPVGADGQLVTFQFVNPGRYLVICMNRSHFLNDWMFGFVNGVGNAVAPSGMGPIGGLDDLGLRRDPVSRGCAGSENGQS